MDWYIYWVGKQSKHLYRLRGLTHWIHRKHQHPQVIFRRYPCVSVAIVAIHTVSITIVLWIVAALIIRNDTTKWRTFPTMNQILSRLSEFDSRNSDETPIPTSNNSSLEWLSTLQIAVMGTVSIPFLLAIVVAATSRNVAMTKSMIFVQHSLQKLNLDCRLQIVIGESHSNFAEWARNETGKCNFMS
jgi:hypothetical protein